MSRATVVFVSIGLLCCSLALSQPESEIENANALFHEIFGEKFSGDEERLLRARALWERLAAEDDVGSKYFLSFLYAAGLGGVERDEARSVRLVEEAAEGGYAPAQFGLASWFESGLYVGRDWDKAVAWYEKAAVQGNVFARSRLRRAYTNGELGLPIDASQARIWQ